MVGVGEGRVENGTFSPAPSPVSIESTPFFVCKREKKHDRNKTDNTLRVDNDCQFNHCQPHSLSVLQCCLTVIALTEKGCGYSCSGAKSTLHKLS